MSISRVCFCLVLFLTGYSGVFAQAQCVSDPVSPTAFQFEIDTLFQGLDASLGTDFPKWNQRYNQRNTTDPSPLFANEDNNQNGIDDDDHIELLGAILAGNPPGTILSGIASANVTDIRNSFASNRAKVRPDLTLTIVFVSVNIIDEITADDPEFGESLQDLVAAYMTIGDAASVTFIRNLLITLGEIFIEQGVESGAIPGGSFVEGLVKDSLRNTVNANFVATRYACFGNAPGATKPNLLGASGNIGGSANTNLAEYNAQGRNRQNWLVAKGVTKPPLQIQPVPGNITVTAGQSATFDVGIVGGDGSFPFYDWKKVNESTGATTRAGTNLLFSFPYALPADAGLYYLIVCDNTWVRSTIPVRLTVNPAPFSIVSQPQGATLTPGANLNLSVTVQGGTAIPTYQWFRGSAANNLTLLNGAANRELSLSNLQIQNSAFYRVDITSGGTVLSSNTVQVLIEEAPDLTPPVLTLNGASLELVECGTAFNDPGATAMDDVDGDITGQIDVSGTVNTAVPGDYALVYTVSDAAGNTATALRTVRVQDTIAPVILLNGSATLVLQCGGAFTDPGATATDSCAGNLTGQIAVQSTLDVDVPGNYSITYSVSDPSSNTAQVIRNIVVEDTVAPLLQLNGSASITIECGASFVEPGATAMDSCAGNLDNAISKTGTVNTQEPGVYTLNYEVSDPSGNSASLERTVTVEDSVPPVLSLNGPDSISLECGTAFTDPGATASDACDGVLDDSIEVLGVVDSATPGNYTLSYTATDLAGNSATKTRTVTVADTMAPEISLLGSESISLECGDTFTDPGATATDGCDGDLSDDITTSGEVDTSSPGVYTIVYEIQDAAGNLSAESRTITVVDSAAPILSLLGPETITLECGDIFEEPGFTATDVCDGDLSDAIEIAGAVDTSQAGVYVITYSVSDNAGNLSQVERTIVVTEEDSPDIALLNSATMTIECGESFIDPGAIATGSCGTDLSASLEVTGSVNTNVVGLYTLTYTATSSAGNETTLTRVVEVVDTTAPVLSLLGPESISLACGETYSEPGASAQDSCDGVLDSDIQVSGAVVTSTPGVYTLSYQVADGSGNVAQAQRTITIFDDTPPMLSLNGPEEVVIGCGQNFVDPGAIAVDGCDGTLSVQVNGEVNLGQEGIYTLDYSATDQSGNTSTISRTIVVVDDCEITINSQPRNLNLYVQSEARFRVEASAGFRKLSYSWFKDGVPIENATDAQLRLLNIDFDDAGAYVCIVSDGEQEIATRAALLQVFPIPEDGHHAADTNFDWSISLSEILRVIQFRNTGGYGCAEGTEDGYEPRGLDQDCLPHDSDYNPQDWQISLSELLRTIQFFNTASGQYHRMEGSEDGFAPGAG